MQNLLLEKVEYQISETGLGRWRRFLYPSGAGFEEFTSHRRYFGLPLFHYTRGVCPETGRRKVARGIIAVGRLAVGGIAVGHAAAGGIAVGQLGLGILLGLGQASCGLFALGQFAIGLILALAQFGIGWVVIAQFGLGQYVLAQAGFGHYLWTATGAHPRAVGFFQPLIRLFSG